MGKIFLFATVFLMSASTFAAGTFPESREYRHYLFKDQATCDEFKKGHGGLGNCYRRIAFEPDGFASLVLTDIAHIASYSVTGDQMTVDVQNSAGEVSGQLKFRVSDNQRALLSADDGTIWKLEAASTCF